MPKAIEAIESAPGVLAVEVNRKTGEATIGTEAGTDVLLGEILGKLEAAGYQGRLAE